MLKGNTYGKIKHLLEESPNIILKLCVCGVLGKHMPLRVVPVELMSSEDLPLVRRAV